METSRVAQRLYAEAFAGITPSEALLEREARRIKRRVRLLRKQAPSPQRKEQV